MYVHGGLDEDYDNVFATITEKMLREKVTINDAKVLSHEIIFIGENSVNFTFI